MLSFWKIKKKKISNSIISKNQFLGFMGEEDLFASNKRILTINKFISIEPVCISSNFKTYINKKNIGNQLKLDSNRIEDSSAIFYLQVKIQGT